MPHTLARIAAGSRAPTTERALNSIRPSDWERIARAASNSFRIQSEFFPNSFRTLDGRRGVWTIVDATQAKRNGVRVVDARERDGEGDA